MFLSSEEFMKLAKAKVYEMALASLCPTDDVVFTIDNVHIVTHAFILKNQKAMVSTTLTDGKYYEVTYNEATSEMYVDQYVKVQNKTYSFMELTSKTEPVKNDEVNVNVQPLYGCPFTPPKENISGAESGDLGVFSTPNPRIYTGAESDEPGILQYPIRFPGNAEKTELNAFMNEFKTIVTKHGIPVVTGHQLNKASAAENEDCVSLDDFVNHVKHEHPDYFPAGEKFIADERVWHDGVRRDIVKHALTISGEKSFALLLDAKSQSLQDIKYFHVDAFKNYADKVCIGKVAHDDLLRHVVKTLYHMDWKANDSHQTLWTEQIADILGIPREEVTDFIVH